MKNIQFKATFTGMNDKDGWKHYQWSITINGVVFEYNTGLAHFTPYTGKRDGSRETVYDSTYKRNKKPDNGLANADLQGWLHVPTLDSVLECLFSDLECGEQSFNDFCDNLCYSNDSLKALDVYRSCMEIAPKLRKALGNEYNAMLAKNHCKGIADE